MNISTNIFSKHCPDTVIDDPIDSIVSNEDIKIYEINTLDDDTPGMIKNILNLPGMFTFTMQLIKTVDKDMYILKKKKVVEYFVESNDTEKIKEYLLNGLDPNLYVDDQFLVNSCKTKEMLNLLLKHGLSFEKCTTNKIGPLIYIPLELFKHLITRYNLDILPFAYNTKRRWNVDKLKYINALIRMKRLPLYHHLYPFFGELETEEIIGYLVPNKIKTENELEELEETEEEKASIEAFKQTETLLKNLEDAHRNNDIERGAKALNEMTTIAENSKNTTIIKASNIINNYINDQKSVHLI